MPCNSVAAAVTLVCSLLLSALQIQQRPCVVSGFFTVSGPFAPLAIHFHILHVHVAIVSLPTSVS